MFTESIVFESFVLFTSSDCSSIGASVVVEESGWTFSSTVEFCSNKLTASSLIDSLVDSSVGKVALLLPSDLLESLLLNNPVNQFHILAKKPSTSSLDGKFIAFISVASITAFSPNILSLVEPKIPRSLSSFPLNRPANQSPILVNQPFIVSKNP